MSKVRSHIERHPELQILASQLTKSEAKAQQVLTTKLVVANAALKQQRAYKKLSSPLFDFQRSQLTGMLDQAKTILRVYADQHVETRWLLSMKVPIVDIINLHYWIDIRKCPKVSSLFRFMGLDPTQPKLTSLEQRRALYYFMDKYRDDSGEITDTISRATLNEIALELRRNPNQFQQIAAYDPITWRSVSMCLRRIPFNRELKTTAYQIGRSIKRHGMTTPYFKFYRMRKHYETVRNDQRVYAEQAAWELERRKHKKRGVVYKQLMDGKLSKMHIESRCMRWTAKIFLTHFHQILYYKYYSELPPKPYILSVLGKENEFACPSWPFM